MKKVTCQMCKAKLEKDNAYKVPKSRGFNYYCNEEEYILLQKEKEEKRNSKTVTCKICKEKILLLDAYKVIVPQGEKTKNEYYCSEQEYKLKRIETEKLNRLKDYYSFEIIGYETGQPFPTNFSQRVEALNAFYDYEIILLTIESHADLLKSYVRTMDFESYKQMTNYLMTIVEDKIGAIYKAWNQRKRQQEKAKTSDSDSIAVDVFHDVMDMPVNQTPTENKGIGSFLDDGDF